MKLLGSIFVQPGNAEQPFVFLDMTGATAEFITMAQVPEEFAKQVVEQGEAISAVPLGVVIDFEGAV